MIRTPHSALHIRYRFTSSLLVKLLIAELLLVAVATMTFFLVAEWAMQGLFDAQISTMVALAGTGERAQNADALRLAFQASVSQAVLVATLAGGISAVLASLFIAERISAPVRRMAEATRRISAGNYAERVRMDMIDPISELTQLAGSFNEMASSLQDTERRRAELLGDVAHELRTPISTLEGYLEGLLDGLVEPSPETWALLHDEAGRLRRLVGDLQDLSRLEARQISLKLEPVDPEAIVKSSLNPLRHLFDEKGLKVVTRLPRGLPCVMADCDRAVQVLTNLLTNALRYTPAPGRVEISVSLYSDQHFTVSTFQRSNVLTEQSDASDWLLFKVADTGMGIAPEHLQRLFERFYRVDRSRSRAVGGSGIGLTVARALIEAMGGLIWAESRGRGKGSTFSFTLPVVK